MARPASQSVLPASARLAPLQQCALVTTKQSTLPISALPSLAALLLHLAVLPILTASIPAPKPPAACHACTPSSPDLGFTGPRATGTTNSHNIRSHGDRTGGMLSTSASASCFPYRISRVADADLLTYHRSPSRCAFPRRRLLHPQRAPCLGPWLRFLSQRCGATRPA